ncbi:MAG TPA: cytochrome c [Pyrinomonadaceae bacterium]|jgi:mono/diheme cytochrome c family protein
MPRGRDCKRAFLTAAACLALAAAVGCDTRAGKPAPAASRADRTRALYERNCATCHGPRGEGQQVGTLSVPSLREGLALASTDDRLFTQIANGGAGMPPFKYTLDDRQIDDLVRFIRAEMQGKK